MVMPRRDAIIHAVGDAPRWTQSPSNVTAARQSVAAVAFVGSPTVRVSRGATVVSGVVAAFASIGSPVVVSVTAGGALYPGADAYPGSNLFPGG